MLKTVICTSIPAHGKPTAEFECGHRVVMETPHQFAGADRAECPYCTLVALREVEKHARALARLFDGEHFSMSAAFDVLESLDKALT